LSDPSNMQVDHEATANTIAVIYGGSQPSLVNQSLHPKPASEEASEYIRALAESAYKGTKSRPYDSVLVGQSSEADGYCDVSFWIGPGNYGQGDETEVVKVLGLSHWAGGKIHPLELASSTHLPLNISSPSSGTSSGDDEAISPLVDLLNRLNDIYAFTIDGETQDGLATLYILLGRFGDEGWAGLVSVGILS